jgi:HK97 family phage prohead protease
MDKFELRDCEIKATGANNRILKFVGSTATRDRYGDEIAVEGWDTKNYKRNPVFLWAHRRDLLPIGRAVNVVQDGEKLKFEIEFAPADINEFAEQVFQHYQQGFLKGVSVGFQSQKSERIDEVSEEELKRKKAKPDLWPGRKFLKQELLELSACPVGANPEALITNKALEAEPTENERRAFDVWLTDAHEDTQSLEASATVKDALADACKEEIPEVQDETEKTTEEATAPTLGDVLTALTRCEARFADLEKKIDGLTTKTAPREPLSDAQADDAAAGEGAKDAGDDVGTADGDSDSDVEIVECSDDLIELDLGAEEDAGAEKSLYESVFES